MLRSQNRLRALTGRGLLAFVVMLSGPINAPAQMPTLSGVTAHFHTNNDDKDDDTRLSVYVYAGPTLIARSENNTGKYNNGSDHDINLNVLGIHDSGQLAHGSTKVMITPNGHDHWEFTYSFDLTWSDGNVTQFTCGSTALSQDDRVYTCTW